jgi:hypothetical protein
MKVLAASLTTALALMIPLAGFSGAVHASESVTEKAQAAGNDAARAVKKGVHRVEEAACMQGDVKCLEEKAKHRVQEASDYTKDKAKQIKNEVDSDDAGE